MLIILAVAGVAQAKVDLTTLPSRDTVQLTIYNSADMTLVRESRALTLKTGANALQFSWENTLIDPTSLEMLPKAQRRPDRHCRAGVSAAGEEPRPLERPEQGQRQGACRDHVPDQRPVLAGLLHGNADAGRKDDAAAGLCPRDQQQRRGLRERPGPPHRRQGPHPRPDRRAGPAAVSLRPAGRGQAARAGGAPRSWRRGRRPSAEVRCPR